MARNGRNGAADAGERVIFEHHEDGTWSARSVANPALVVRGGSMAQARKRVREALTSGRSRKTPLVLREEIQLPKAGAEAVLRLERARQAIDAAERDAVTVLVRRLGLGVRDAAIALGLSMRRVVHLAGEVADVEAERRYERRAAAHR